jgi:hypothetical protein
VSYTPANDKGYFPVDGDIEFDFISIPDGAIASAVLTKNPAGTAVAVHAPATITGNTVTVSPAQLEPNTVYGLSLRILREDRLTIYTSPTAVATGATVGPVYATDKGVSFKVAPYELILTGTNLYTGEDGLLVSPATNAAIFPGGKIVFTFAGIPANAVPVVEFYQGTTKIATVAEIVGDTVEVTPARLTRDTTYTLKLKILAGGTQRTLYGSPESGGGPALYINTTDKAIEFKTGNIKKVSVVKTNLYTDAETGIDYGASSSVNDTDQFTFAADGNIELTFDTVVPTGATLKAVLQEVGGNTVLTDKSFNADRTVLTIDPQANLKAGQTYYLSLTLYDAAGDTYYTVPTADTQVLNITNRTTVDYITFSVEKPQSVVLVGTNLYKDGDVAYYSEAYFKLAETIVLTFNDLSTVTDIKDVALGTSVTVTPATTFSSYARIDGNTVKITPNAPLTATATYYLKFKLVAGVNDVWTVPDLAATGRYDPVYINHNASGDSIAFKTVTKFTILPYDDTISGGVVTALGPNLTNIDITTPTTIFDATDDIVLEFDRPIKTVTKAQLVYKRNSLVYGITVSSGTLSEDKKVLTLPTLALLAPSGTYAVRLLVVSDDDQTLLYDSTNYGEFAVGASTADIGFTVHSDVRHYGKKSAVAAGTIRIVTPLPMPNDHTGTNEWVALEFTPSDVSFSQGYDVYRGRQGIWELTALTGGDLSSTVSVPARVVAPQGFSAKLSAIPGSESKHVDAENIYYKVRGVNSAGYVIESPATPSVTFVVP